MTEFEQFAFDLDLDTSTVAQSALSRHVKAGPARLLRRLVTTGLDPGALDAAAALVAELDSEPTS